MIPFIMNETKFTNADNMAREIALFLTEECYIDGEYIEIDNTLKNVIIRTGDVIIPAGITQQIIENYDVDVWEKGITVSHNESKHKNYRSIRRVLIDEYNVSEDSIKPNGPDTAWIENAMLSPDSIDELTAKYNVAFSTDAILVSHSVRKDAARKYAKKKEELVLNE